MSQQTIQTPFRADVVGSFLRPEALKKARKDFEEGRITATQLREIEDQLITDLIAKQKAHGLKAITDGEFRRAYWHLDFMWDFEGIGHIELAHGYQFHGEETTKGSIRLTGRIGGHAHPFVEDYKFVKQFEEEGIVAKQTLPAPAQLLAELFRGDNTLNTLRVYPDGNQLEHDIAAAYRQVILDLYAAGCRNVQLDDCTWGMIVDGDYWKSKMNANFSLETDAERYLRVNNLALENLPDDLVVNTHVCRGNYHSTYACRGAYDPVAPYLFARANVDAFYLEFDDERSGGFEPLKYVPAGKKVVLGLVTTKSPVLEDRRAVIDRIHEAARYVPLGHLYLSPQCGFASCEIGNKLTEEEQWAKVDLVCDIARAVWGE